MMTSQSKPLIAGVLRKSIGSAGAGSPGQPAGFSVAERAAVREACRDGRDAKQRTIDQVVDRLLRELTW